MFCGAKSKTANFIFFILQKRDMQRRRFHVRQLLFLLFYINISATFCFTVALHIQTIAGKPKLKNNNSN